MRPALALSRRRLLAGAGLALVAGCGGSPDGDDVATEPAGDDSPTPNTAMGTERASGADASTSTTPSPVTASSATPETERPTQGSGTLDLHEANVVGVEVERSGDSYRFSVTLYHDDDGEDGYADWWQVETLEGEQLGRRTLLHAHSTAPFTRSETLSVPQDIRYVVVRGHDQTHGYGGQAMVVNLRTGETEAVQQGPEPRDFSTFDPTI